MNVSFATLLTVLFAIFIEIYLLFTIGSSLGGLITIFLVVFSSVLGYLLVKHQTGNTLANVQQSLMRGEAPNISIVEAGVLMFGGVLLMVPGFITDVMGLLTLFPPVRRLMAQRILRQVMQKAGMVMNAAVNMHEQQPTAVNDSINPTEEPDPSKETIEGEYKRED